MKQNTTFTIVLILSIILGFTSISNATTFGKNKVNYTYFTWKYLTTEHFDIYYNQGGLEITNFAAEVAEEAYKELSRKLNYSPEENNPIVIITYQSHNDFEQTNVSGSSPSESTGGFTEFLKNRIVVPFEGDHEKFRHVIHHELTHAIYLDLLFGQGFGAIVSGLSQARIPLWFTEGLAEFESRKGLDPETEMILRDAVLNDILPEIRELDYAGYLGAYKCGQSVLYWIAWRYGDEKIGELLHHLKRLRDFDRALKAAIGIDQKELSKRWRRFIKERYWPQVIETDQPDVAAKQLTDHKKDFCYINNSPAISPNGEWIAFLSDRSDYFDVYLMSTIDGKVHKRLVRGQRSGQFEELHWLRPGITWSPDGKQIAFCAKAGELDALYIIDVKDGKITKSFTYRSDALFSPSWSHDGKKIALIHVLDGRSNLATVEIESGKLTLITDDLFDEADPSWSPDSQQLLFTSNRGQAELNNDSPPKGTLFGYAYDEFDIFEVNVETKELSRLTNDRFVERTPIWTPIENTILYVSNRSGIYNLYLHNLDTDKIHSITNYVTGALQPTISTQSQAVAFSCYYNKGYDIFLLNDPFNEELQVTAWETPETYKIPDSQGTPSDIGISSRDYSHFVFNRIEPEGKDKEVEVIDSTMIENRTKNEDGFYPTKDYEVSLNPDLVFVNAGYSPYYAMQGSGLIMFSDVIGNHNLYISLNLYHSIEWSNVFLNYEYLAKRINYSVGFYHYAYLFYGDRVNWQDRSYGLFLSMGYPFSRYNRMDFGLTYHSIERSVLEYDENKYHDIPPVGSICSTILPSIGYVHDTSIWRSTVEPSNGGRWRVNIIGSPDILGDKNSRLEFITLSADWRRYFNYKKDYSFAFRLSGAASEGRDPQRFYLGGMLNWFNPRWDNEQNDVIADSIEAIYYASFITPLRGVGFYNSIGTRYLLGNAEFRFPFIRYLIFGWPLPAYFHNIRGALFTDIGTAWKPDDLNGQLFPDKWTRGFGFGLRLDLGIFPIEWDVAWSPDPSSNMVPRYYFSINAGF